MRKENSNSLNSSSIPRNLTIIKSKKKFSSSSHVIAERRLTGSRIDFVLKARPKEKEEKK